MGVWHGEWVMLAIDDHQKNTSKIWQWICLYHSDNLERARAEVTLPHSPPPNIFIVCPQLTLLPHLCGVWWLWFCWPCAWGWLLGWWLCGWCVSIDSLGKSWPGERNTWGSGWMPLNQIVTVLLLFQSSSTWLPRNSQFRLPTFSFCLRSLCWFINYNPFQEF